MAATTNKKKTTKPKSQSKSKSMNKSTTHKTSGRKSTGKRTSSAKVYENSGLLVHAAVGKGAKTKDGRRRFVFHLDGKAAPGANLQTAIRKFYKVNKLKGRHVFTATGANTRAAKARKSITISIMPKRGTNLLIVERKKR